MKAALHKVLMNVHGECFLAASRWAVGPTGVGRPEKELDTCVRGFPHGGLGNLRLHHEHHGVRAPGL